MQYLIIMVFMAAMGYVINHFRRNALRTAQAGNDSVTSEMKYAIEKYKLEQKSFTLIEVTMAIAIIAIGMMGIMAIFPIGFQATRNAMADNYTSEMADQLLHIVAFQSKQYKDGGTTTDGWGEWITDTPNKANDADILALPDNKADSLSPVTASARIENIIKKASNGAVFGDGAGGRDKDTCGLYYDNNGVKGLFYMEDASGQYKDFECAMVLWKERLEYDTNNDGTIDNADPPIPYEYAARLCLEVSWPIMAPYANREKRYYVLEIFNPNER